MTYLLKTTAKAVAIGLASMAASAVVLAAPTPVEFDLTGHDDFVKSLGSEVTGRQVKSADEAKAILTKVYNEKLEQHVSSLHYEKGVTCVSCHDQQKQGGPDWMTAVTNPPMKKACGDCHETQAYVVSKTASGVTCVSCHDQQKQGGPDWMTAVTNPPMKKACGDCHETQAYVVSKTASHSEFDCIACHMPNASQGPNDGSQGKMDAVRRLHTYDINVSPDATTWTKGEDGAWKLAQTEDGHGYVDLMWSCARNAPADYVVAEGRGCHSKATSELDPGLIYEDQKEVYGEVLKWQNPVKAGYKDIKAGVERINKLLEVTKLTYDQQTQIRLLEVYGEVLKWQNPVKAGYKDIKAGVERINKLLEVTKLTYDQQTQIRLLLDKATEVADLIEKDGSWGAHASHYLQDRVKSALSYVGQAQTLLDKGGLDKATEVADLIEKDGSWGAHASHYLQDRVKSALSYVGQAQTLLDKGGY